MKKVQKSIHIKSHKRVVIKKPENVKNKNNIVKDYFKNKRSCKNDKKGNKK